MSSKPESPSVSLGQAIAIITFLFIVGFISSAACYLNGKQRGSYEAIQLMCKNGYAQYVVHPTTGERNLVLWNKTKNKWNKPITFSLGEEND